ncbi:MAG: 50S ribosomal protein L24 [Candidatus Micrarchaeaceae archaeon]
MIKSAKPRKQRKFRFTAPNHTRQNFINVHISKELSEKLGIKRRSIEARKGDTVKIMAGDSKGKSGKITAVSLKTGKIMVDGIVRKNSKNKELQIAIYASNTYLTDMDLSDKLRKAEIDGIKAKK